MLISKEDLNWLYWGNETEQIVAKLTNQKDNFENFLERKIKMHNAVNNGYSLSINNFLYNIIDTLNARNDLYSNFNLSKDQVSRLYKLNEKYKFKSYNEDTKDAIALIKKYYCFNDFLEPQKLITTLQKIQILLNQYEYKRDYNEIKEIIKDAFGYL
jgi:hypothetical protein